jgi:hypothetical protein
MGLQERREVGLEVLGRQIVGTTVEEIGATPDGARIGLDRKHALELGRESGYIVGGEKPPKDGGKYPHAWRGNPMAEIVGMPLRASRSFPRRLGTPC